jgi:hypothetical protein
MQALPLPHYAPHYIPQALDTVLMFLVKFIHTTVIHIVAQNASSTPYVVIMTSNVGTQHLKLVD